MVSTKYWHPVIDLRNDLHSVQSVKTSEEVHLYLSGKTVYHYSLSSGFCQQ